MVCLPPPHIAGNSRSYLEAYNEIIAAHRRSPLASASSVIMLVGPNVDALSAARMLASLFKQDDVVYRIIPVSGMEYTNRLVQRLRGNKDVRTFHTFKCNTA
jgi:cell division control protein 45